MGQKQETIEKIDTDVFNATHKVQLPNNRYTNKVFLTTDLGSFSDSSSFDQDALVDVMDSIALNVNGEQFEVDGPLVDFLNTMSDGLSRQEQLEIGLQTAMQNMVSHGPRGSDYATCRLEIDTAKVSDISDGSVSAHNDDAEIIVSGELADRGRTTAMQKISKSREDIHTGGDSFELRQNGEWRSLVLEEEGVDMDELKIEVNLPGDEVIVVDDPVNVVRERNVRQAGTTDLPSGMYFIDLTKSEKFDSENINYIDVSVEASTSGILGVWNHTVQKASN